MAGDTPLKSIRDSQTLSEENTKMFPQSHTHIKYKTTSGERISILCFAHVITIIKTIVEKIIVHFNSSVLHEQVLGYAWLRGAGMHGCGVARNSSVCTDPNFIKYRLLSLKVMLCIVQ